MTKNRTMFLLIGCAVLCLAVVTSCVAQTATADTMFLGLSPVNTPVPVDRDPEESRREDEELRKNEKITEVNFGPESAGMEIRIAGKAVKLKDDTYIEFFVSGVTCPVGSECQEPFIVLKRGESTIAFVTGTGEMFVDPNRTPDQQQRDREAFKYIEDILKEKQAEGK